MEVKAKKVGKVAVINVTGRIDSATAPTLNSYLQMALEKKSTHLVLDFSAVEFTSSAGLRALLLGAKEAQTKGGRLVLAAVKPQIEKVISLAGFSKFIKLFPDVDSAVKSLS
jgi:anti-sigma B factor antagonist